MKYLWVNATTHVVTLTGIVLTLWSDPQFQELYQSFVPVLVQQYIGLIVFVAFVIAKTIPQGVEIEVEE